MRIWDARCKYRKPLRPPSNMSILTLQNEWGWNSSRDPKVLKGRIEQVLGLAPPEPLAKRVAHQPTYEEIKKLSGVMPAIIPASGEASSVTADVSSALPVPEGLKIPATIKNLYDRPIFKNADGTVSTTLSMSIGTDQGEVLIPTVINGKKLTPRQAIEHFRKTGEHLGIFDTPEHADAYAIKLHNEQARRMGKTP